jgi:hypothetical protein
MEKDRMDSSLQAFRKVEPELTAIFEVALSEARRSVDFSVRELDWYSNRAKDLSEEFRESEDSMALELG